MSLLARLHERFVFRRRVRVLGELVAELVPPDASVLDVGCGDGSIARAVARQRPDVAVRGLDVLVRPDAAIPVEPFDGVTIPRADGSVDAVLLVDVLHHTDDPERLLGEALRVARRAVVIKDHTREGLLAGLTLRLMDWVGNAPHGVALPYNYWRRERWHEAFRRLGAAPAVWVDRLRLYPPPASWLFDRSLHFVARLEPAARGRTAGAGGHATSGDG